jgi:hypothetical protein
VLALQLLGWWAASSASTWFVDIVEFANIDRLADYLIKCSLSPVLFDALDGFPHKDCDLSSCFVILVCVTGKLKTKCSGRQAYESNEKFDKVGGLREAELMTDEMNIVVGMS